MIQYRIDADAPETHLFRITLTVDEPAAQQVVSLPAWIPGSYLVREFARHLSALEVRQRGRAVGIEQIDKASWRIDCKARVPLALTYQVYAFDASVRAAYLDTQRGFFNGTSLCLRMHGHEAAPHGLRIGTLPRGWDVATAMRPAHGGKAGRSGMRFEANDYDELVDHPVVLGKFWRGRFTAGGVAHEFVVDGAWPTFDGDRLLADAKRICETQIAFWHGKKKPPFERYVFMLHVVDDGYGGLEHRASTALIASRRDLPRRGQQGAISDGYVTLLGLISHEYFHTWNVKRLKPAEFARYDYTRENYTRLLWFFEGFTSYYDDLFLVRAGLIDEARYFKLVARTINNVLGTPGRKLQSVAQASFDAWVKYYRGDENTPNATVSYYTKGSLVALALDLALREEGNGTLDDVLRSLWQHSDGGPISEVDIGAKLGEVGGRAMDKELTAWVHGTADLPLQALLTAMGVQWRTESPTVAQRLGVRVSEGALTGVQVKSVLRDGAAERAGIAAGDELLAVNGWRLRRLDDVPLLAELNAELDILVSRDQRIVELQAKPADVPGAVTLVPADKPGREALALRRKWLGG
jgi:predicted metalloprotease with PDZ domain